MSTSVPDVFLSQVLSVLPGESSDCGGSLGQDQVGSITSHQDMHLKKVNPTLNPGLKNEVIV